MMPSSVDVLMITYNRAEYTRLSLSRLLETADEHVRVWLWHNGTHEETLHAVRTLASHPRVYEFHHSVENKLLREPTNWFWRRAMGDLLGKVDDDCLAPYGWIPTFRAAHNDIPNLGAVSCWIFLEEDFVPELATPKIQEHNGHLILRNHWVGGSGYLLKRKCVEEHGPLRNGQSFSNFCLRLARRGWVNGYYYPFLYMDHMDDPRSPNTRLTGEESFKANPSLSARRFGIDSLEELTRRSKSAAIDVQAASINPRHYWGWRHKLRRIRDRLLRRSKVAKFNA
jgi:hypothetical protein